MADQCRYDLARHPAPHPPPPSTDTTGSSSPQLQSWQSAQHNTIHCQVKSRLLVKYILVIKTSRPLREGFWSWTPPDYWQTHTDVWLYSMCHGAFAAFGKTSPNIDHYKPNIWPWPLTLTSSNDLDLKSRSKTRKCDIKTQFITVWPWPLTYDLDLQSQPSQGQGRPSCQISRS